MYCAPLVQYDNKSGFGFDRKVRVLLRTVKTQNTWVMGERRSMHEYSIKIENVENRTHGTYHTFSARFRLCPTVVHRTKYVYVMTVPTEYRYIILRCGRSAYRGTTAAEWQQTSRHNFREKFFKLKREQL